MTTRPHGWRLGLLAMVGMLMMLVAPALPVAAQGDPATDFNTTISSLASMTPVAGPLSGSIDAANAQTVPAGVSVANGAAHAEFIVPSVAAGTLWAIAMEFRVSDAGKNFLLVFPDGTWQLDNGVQGGGAKGTGATFDTTAGATVALDVVFDGASGAFGVNGAFVSELDLSAVQGAGDVNLTGYLGLGSGAPSLDYTNFSVYDLQGGPAPATTATASPVSGVATEAATTVAVPTTATTTGDPAATFDELIAQEATAPMVYGPTSGAMIHDPEKVTFEQTGVTVTDFGTHIECTAPRTAAELWDCGIAFRDTTSPNHYRLGVVSDGHWFLSVGAGDPLQQGEGIPIPPNAGDTISIDLVVQGTTGYFGVDGTFVSELDLSQIPGPGTVTAVVGFFNETYVPGGQTAFEDFSVWSFDQGAAPASETAVVGVPTETPVAGLPTVAPTVQGPPTNETPTTAAGVPTEAPTVAVPPAETATTAAGLPTETATTTASTDMPGVDVATNTYTSPSFGYQLSWDDTWSPVTASSQESFDVLRLTNDTTTTDLYSGVSSMGLEQCITSLIEYYQGNASYANIVQVPYSDGQLILTQGNVATSWLTFDYTDDSGLVTATTDSVICVSLPDLGALVTMESYIPTVDFDSQIGAVQTLESQLVVDGAPVVLPPVPGGTGAATSVATTEALPTATTAGETPAAVPTVASSGSGTFALAGVGSAVSGIGTLDGQARTVNVSAILIGAEPGSVVGIAAGSCAELANVLEPDYFVGEVNDTGIVQGSVPVSLSVLQSRGPYAVVVYGPGEGAAMVACGEITVG